MDNDNVEGRFTEGSDGLREREREREREGERERELSIRLYR